MCGVAGCFFTESGSNAVERINVAQRHRGPESSDVVGSGQWCLGHTRLEIVGLGPTGDQPLFSQSGRWAVVFNGEIYNHQALRQEFGLFGLSPSDGSVIPELIERLGTDAFALLQGMYAIVAVDTWSSEVLLAIDPLGIKPLHWTQTQGRLLVASEPKAFEEAGVALEPDSTAIRDLLAWGSVRSTHCSFVGVNRLLPGEWRLFRGIGQSEAGSTSFWRPAEGPMAWDGAVAAFHSSVRRHMVSDVPLALLLSDGVDSTALAYSMSLTDATFTALTVDMGGSRDEIDGARSTCDRLGIPLEEVRQVPSDEDVARFFSAMQHPTLDGFNTFLVSKAIRGAGLKVGVSGLGGDELLCGYPYHQRFSYLRRAAFLPNRLAAPLLAKTQSGVETAQMRKRLAVITGGRWPRTATDVVALARILRPLAEQEDVLRTGGARDPSDLANELTRAEVDLYLKPTLLPDTDAFSMAHSVEMRVPYLDSELFSAVMSVPSRSPGKADFVRHVDAPVVSDAALRPKQGFTIPLAAWLADGCLSHALHQATVRSAPWRHFAAGEVEAEIPPGAQVSSLESALKSPMWRRVWSIVVLDQWLRSL